MNEQIRLFFTKQEKVEEFLAKPRKAYSRIQRLSRDLANTSPKDLFIKICGVEDCMPTKLPTDGTKTLNSIHYILKGEGTFIVNGKEYHLSKGAVFCAMKNLDNSYFPSKKNPWSYVFIGLGGVLADSIVKYLGLDGVHCVISPEKASFLRESFLRVYVAFDEAQMSSFKVLSALYGLIADLETVCFVKKSRLNENDRHVFKALESIRNIGVSATADSVAKACGLNRIYLSRIVKQRTGLSLQDLLIATKLFVAQDYLKFGDVSMTIGEIARLSGYTDVKYFTKLFKYVVGVSPTEYRRNFDKSLQNQ